MTLWKVEFRVPRDQITESAYFKQECDAYKFCNLHYTARLPYATFIPDDLVDEYINDTQMLLDYYRLS